ncbi:MAG: YHS domain-containing protein [Fimbriimonadales bacterium]|nr:YHS domain-containing protein [Fimbriimonadales bacterium]
MRKLWLTAAVLSTSLLLGSVAFAQTSQANQTARKTQQAKQSPTKKQQIRCPVSGKVITDIKKAPKLTYQGKTYYFSCRNCLAEFRKNPQKYLQQASNTRAVSNTAKKDGACCNSEAQAGNKSCCAGEKTTAQKAGSCCAEKQPAAQTAAAPSEKLLCPVTGEELKLETAVRVVYNGKVYYVGCAGCKAAFLKDPETYARKAEQLSKLQGKPEQSEQSKQPEPKDTVAAPADKLLCPITGEELEEATAVRFTYNGKVYYTCCNSCKSKFLRDPETYAKKAEALSKLQGKPDKTETNT